MIPGVWLYTVAGMRINIGLTIIITRNVGNVGEVLKLRQTEKLTYRYALLSKPLLWIYTVCLKKTVHVLFRE